ncbi:hypothetical protein AB0M43_00275 [Longispora sp. NPDC051575]|uniref:hypothetical protein n=1 Tax=Longispora sp. NPDC051575 TaxID=3154943 RepID=UPI003412A702
MRTNVARDGAGLVLGVLLAGTVLTAAGCTDEERKPADPAPNTAQPSGSWTVVRWLKSRSDTEAGHGEALERRLTLTPSCGAGRCDIAVKPDGANGTYLPEGYASPDPPKAGAPYTLSWKDGGYEHVDPASLVSCTAVGGTVVPDGYEVTSTTTLTFTPPKDGKPAALRGTYKDRAKGVGPGIAAKCTDFDSEWEVAGAPTRAALDEAVDLAGKYVVTEVVQAVEPPGARPPGYSGNLFDPAVVAKAAPGWTVTGTGPPATLTAGAGGWGGETSTPMACNLGAGDIAGGFTRVETWSRLRPVVSTAQGAPVLTGRWSLRFVPTPAGAAAGCAASSNTGYVLFVPAGAV